MFQSKYFCDVIYFLLTSCYALETERSFFFPTDRFTNWNEMFFSLNQYYFGMFTFFWIIFSSQFVRSNYYSSYSENIPREFDGTLYGDVYNWIDLIQNYIQ